MRENVILMRAATRRSEWEEFEAAEKYFRVATSRCDLQDALVVGRYSVLPFYEDLELDLSHHDSRLINSHDQHRWIADFHYYRDLKDFTFESWTEDEYPRCGYDGPVVVKGSTNSRKHQWDTSMFAADRRAAIRVGIKLKEDYFIGRQPLIYRKYTPLVTYEVGLNGLPFTNEHRLFFLGTELVASGYYWSEAEDVDKPLSAEGMEFAREVAEIASRHVDFFVLDIGEKAEGGWVLIEINDGQMSGLSMIEPDAFYRGLKSAIEHRFGAGRAV